MQEKVKQFIDNSRKEINMCSDFDTFENWQKVFSRSPVYNNLYVWSPKGSFTETTRLPKIIFSELTEIKYDCDNCRLLYNSESEAMNDLKKALLTLGIIKQIYREEDKIKLVKKWMEENKKEALFNGKKWVWQRHVGSLSWSYLILEEIFNKLNMTYDGNCDIRLYETKHEALISLANALIETGVTL